MLQLSKTLVIACIMFPLRLSNFQLWNIFSSKGSPLYQGTTDKQKTRGSKKKGWNIQAYLVFKLLIHLGSDSTLFDKQCYFNIFLFLSMYMYIYLIFKFFAYNSYSCINQWSAINYDTGGFSEKIRCFIQTMFFFNTYKRFITKYFVYTIT